MFMLYFNVHFTDEENKDGSSIPGRKHGMNVMRRSLGNVGMEEGDEFGEKGKNQFPQVIKSPIRVFGFYTKTNDGLSKGIKQEMT